MEDAVEDACWFDCASARFADGPLCGFFEMNLKGDFGDLGEIGLKGDLSMKSGSS